MEADAFAKSLDQPAESHDDTFEAFTKIVDTFIKDNSAFEINIDFATKKRILAMADEAEFKKTSSVSVRRNGLTRLNKNSGRVLHHGWLNQQMA